MKNKMRKLCLVLSFVFLLNVVPTYVVLADGASVSSTTKNVSCTDESVVILTPDSAMELFGSETISAVYEYQVNIERNEVNANFIFTSPERSYSASASGTLQKQMAENGEYYYESFMTGNVNLNDNYRTITIGLLASPGFETTNAGIIIYPQEGKEEISEVVLGIGDIMPSYVQDSIDENSRPQVQLNATNGNKITPDDCTATGFLENNSQIKAAGLLCKYISNERNFKVDLVPFTDTVHEYVDRTWLISGGNTWVYPNNIRIGLRCNTNSIFIDGMNNLDDYNEPNQGFDFGQFCVDILTSLFGAIGIDISPITGQYKTSTYGVNLSSGTDHSYADFSFSNENEGVNNYGVPVSFKLEANHTQGTGIITAYGYARYKITADLGASGY